MLRVQLAVLTFLLCEGLSSKAQGPSESWLQVDQHIHEVFRKHRPASQAEFHRIADSIHNHGLVTCEDELTWAVMELNGWAWEPDFTPIDWVRKVEVRPSCELLSARFHFLKGALFYRERNWDLAIQSMKVAVELSQDSTFKSETYNNLSSAYERKYPHSDSVRQHLELALRFARDQNPPHLLNNLAAHYLRIGDWERAAFFLGRIDTDRVEIPVNLKFNIVQNQLEVAMHTGDCAAIEQGIEVISALPITPGNQCNHALILSKSLLFSDNYAKYVEQYVRLQSALLECSQEERESQLEAALFQPVRKSLFEGDSALVPVDEARWALLQLALSPSDGRTLSRFGAIPKAEPTGSGEPAWYWFYLPLMGLVFTGVWGARLHYRLANRPLNPALAVQIRKGLQHLALLVEERHGEIEVIEEIQRLEREWLTGQVRLRVNAVSQEPELSPIEEEVLLLIANGRSSKDIARMKDLSVSYVYNIRVKLRKKFDIPEGVEISEWIQREATFVKD